MEPQKTHWLQSANKNYLGNWDLPENRDLILTIESAKWEEVKNPIKNTIETKKVVRFKEKGIKPLICNQINSERIMKSTGKKFMEDSIGCKISLFVDQIIDKRTKDVIDCVRVRAAAAELPNIPNDKIKEVIEAVKNKTFTIEQIEKKYKITDEQKKLMK